MNRRRFVATLLVLAAAPAAAHTPYRQWKIMRERFLLVHSTRTNPESDRIADRLVETLLRVVPESHAMTARARDERRVASLLTTGQAMLAVMRPQQARALYLRSGEYSGFEGAQLRVLLEVDDHLLVTVERFPWQHAWLVTAALVENPDGLSVRVPEPVSEAPPVHPGAIAFARGEPLKPES